MKNKKKLDIKNTKKPTKKNSVDKINIPASILLGSDVSSQFRQISKNNSQKNVQDLANSKILQIVDNPHIGTDFVIRFTCPEFTSICPITSQPDFAHLVIDYIASDKIIESKSLKLYLHSFRNHGAFHEDCTIKIAKDIMAISRPKWFRIAGYWYPRGGIPIDIFYQNKLPPKSVLIPDLGVSPYRGRG